MATDVVKASTRGLALVLALGGLLGTGAGCSALRGLDEYTIGDPAPAPTGATTTDTSSPPPAVTDTGATVQGCQSNHECIQLAARDGSAVSRPAAPAVCVNATGRCVPLATADCTRIYGDYTNDHAVVIGALLGEGASASALEQAAVLATAEIDASGGLPPGASEAFGPSDASAPSGRPLVLVACNTGGDVLRATRHLTDDLRVPAIVGPTSGEQVVSVTQQVSAKAGTLLITPTSPVSAISNLADGDLTWRATPSDAQRAKLVIEQINELETLLRATRSLTTVKLGIVHATDALGASARDAIAGKLILNGRFINDAANASNASVDAYEPGSGSAEAAIATKYAATFRPDIVFVTAAEQIANVVVPLEQALGAARVVNRPYYVLTDAARTQELLDQVASAALPSDIRRRVRGVGVKPDASSSPVLDAFRAAFSARYGAPPPEPAAAVTYDATYAIAYALAATASPSPSGANVAHGLRTLAVGSPASTGASSLGSAMHDLASGKSVSLRGTFGLMQWDASGDITGGTIEVWCLGALAGAPAFGSSGVTMDVETQVVGGAFVQCQ